MSLKIFNAMRAPAKRINEAIDFLHDHLFAGVMSDYKDLLQAVDVDELDRKYNCRTEAERKFYRHYMVSDFIDRLKAELTRCDRALPVLECGFSLWVKMPYIYIIIDGPNKYYSDLFASGGKLSDKCPSWLENFEFQDQIRTGGEFAFELTDEYKARGEAWIALIRGKVGTKTAYNARRLYHSVFQPGIQPWAELQTLYEKQAGAGELTLQVSKPRMAPN